jgi:predicted tellurium resistance membrane protein TerC
VSTGVPLIRQLTEALEAFVHQHPVLQKILGYPLFVVGLASLVTGIALNFYWGMLLGLLFMAYGALKFTDRWG